jgi:hypothetical protein
MDRGALKETNTARFGMQQSYADDIALVLVTGANQSTWQTFPSCPSTVYREISVVGDKSLSYMTPMPGSEWPS